jgi:hypothetical protein
MLSRSVDCAAAPNRSDDLFLHENALRRQDQILPKPGHRRWSPDALVGKGAKGRVEDGRGNLRHAATPRFPSPLIERSVRISRTALSDWFHREAHGAADKGKRSRRSRRCSP